MIMDQGQLKAHWQCLCTQLDVNEVNAIWMIVACCALPRCLGRKRRVFPYRVGTGCNWFATFVQTAGTHPPAHWSWQAGETWGAICIHILEQPPPRDTITRYPAAEKAQEVCVLTYLL